MCLCVEAFSLYSCIFIFKPFLPTNKWKYCSQFTCTNVKRRMSSKSEHLLFSFIRFDYVHINTLHIHLYDTRSVYSFVYSHSNRHMYTALHIHSIYVHTTFRKQYALSREYVTLFHIIHIRFYFIFFYCYIVVIPFFFLQQNKIC